MIGATALVAVGVVRGVVGGALAATGTFDPAKEQQAFLNDAAGRLGITSDKLEAALKAAAIDRVDAALAAGRITQAQAQAMKDGDQRRQASGRRRLPARRLRPPPCRHARRRQVHGRGGHVPRPHRPTSS